MADERKEKKEGQKDPRRRILLVSILIEAGILVGIKLLFLLPSIVSTIASQAISLASPSSGRALTGITLGIVGMIVGVVVFKKGIWRRIFLILVLIGTFVVISSPTLPTISVATFSLWTILIREIVRIIVMVVVGFLLIYWWWAPNNLFFTFVVEGTAKIVVKGGEVVDMLIQWEGRTFDKEWNVIEGDDGWHPFGGLRFYGIWPTHDIYVYRLRWINVHADGTIAKHDEALDSVMLKDMIYCIEVDGAEDKNRIPLNVRLLLTLRITNLYKALFKGQDWMELLNRMQPLFREHVANVPFEELIGERQKVGGELWEKLEKEGLIQEFKEDYGIDFKEGGIEMKDITPPPEYQKAATKKYLADREAEERSGETIGAVINMIAMAEGKSVQEVQKQINQDAELSKEFREFCKDLIHRKMAIDGAGYVDIRVSGASGLEKSLLELIALWKQMSQTDKVTKRDEEKAKKKDKKEDEN